MPELDFQVTGVEPANRGLTPLLQFKLAVRNEGESIHAVLLNAQIQIQSPRRPYNAREKLKLVELFGKPEQWGQTLRNRLWTHTHATLGAFSRQIAATLPVQCTYDLTLAATKYFHALEEGDVPLLFLFSGTVFYAAADGRLQVQQISWNKECLFRMPLPVWEHLMQQHFPNSAWLYLNRDVFERLYTYKRDQGHVTWEQTIEQLLATQELEAATA